MHDMNGVIQACSQGNKNKTSNS